VKAAFDVCTWGWGSYGARRVTITRLFDIIEYVLQAAAGEEKEEVGERQLVQRYQPVSIK